MIDKNQTWISVFYLAIQITALAYHIRPASAEMVMYSCKNPPAYDKTACIEQGKEVIQTLGCTAKLGDDKSGCKLNDHLKTTWSLWECNTDTLNCETPDYIEPGNPKCKEGFELKDTKLGLDSMIEKICIW